MKTRCSRIHNISSSCLKSASRIILKSDLKIFSEEAKFYTKYGWKMTRIIFDFLSTTFHNGKGELLGSLHKFYLPESWIILKKTFKFLFASCSFFMQTDWSIICIKSAELKNSWQRETSEALKVLWRCCEKFIYITPRKHRNSSARRLRTYTRMRKQTRGRAFEFYSRESDSRSQKSMQTRVHKKTLNPKRHSVYFFQRFPDGLRLSIKI